MFIEDCVNQLKEKNIQIDNKYFECQMILQIYKYYLNKTNDDLLYGFDYNIKPILLNDVTFWKVCTIEINGYNYLYHKNTNLLFEYSNNAYNWIGLLDINNNIVIDRKECNFIIKNWIIKCGFV
jgi:hypothetical protein